MIIITSVGWQVNKNRKYYHEPYICTYLSECQWFGVDRTVIQCIWVLRGWCTLYTHIPQPQCQMYNYNWSLYQCSLKINTKPTSIAGISLQQIDVTIERRPCVLHHWQWNLNQKTHDNWMSIIICDPKWLVTNNVNIMWGLWR